MATKESKRVNTHRRKNFDRVTILVEKGCTRLLHIAALREGVSMTEMIRRAIIARCGLRVMPYPDQLAELDDVTTPEEARKAILRLQAHETSSEIIQHLIDKLSPEPRDAQFLATMGQADIHDFRNAVKQINTAIDAEEPEDNVFAEPVTVKLSGLEVGVLRRMLANMIPQDTDEKTTE